MEYRFFAAPIIPRCFQFLAFICFLTALVFARSATAWAQASQDPPAQTPPTAPAAGGGGSTANTNVFNPDIAVIGDFLATAGRNKVNPAPAFEMHESEVALQSVIDPYARADFFISFGEEGVELEEGFITFPTVPGGFLVKAGKMRSAFGRVNTQHNHVLPWTDRPLVTNNLVGGEEGIGDAGFSIARLIPIPGVFLEATAQVFRGDSGDLFKSSTRADISTVGHLRFNQDITENTNFDLGGSYARGHNSSGIIDDVDVGRFTTSLFGVDATYRWRPLARSIYRSFIVRSEVVWSRRHQPEGRQNARGFFVSGDYQFARRWYAGLRYDRSDRADSASLRDTGESLTFTYAPSEFSQIRGQFRRTNYADGPRSDEVVVQFKFLIGAHSAHPF